MNVTALSLFSTAALMSLNVVAENSTPEGAKKVTDRVISQQRQNLAENFKDKGFGPQSPRDIGKTSGKNPVIFGHAPAHSEMNLCNIHFHKYAEHKGGEFTKYAGNGDGKGYYTGYEYSGSLAAAELAPVDHPICPSKHGSLSPGDTIEAHYVYSTAQVEPGPSLGSCLDEEINNPQLRVETQVYVLVNDKDARDFPTLAKHGEENGYHQALNIPEDTGTPIQYAGSTTGPAYNEKGSPLQVTWNVRTEIAKVNIQTLGTWCKDNVFNEDHAHGSRNLVTNLDLLSEIQVEKR